MTAYHVLEKAGKLEPGVLVDFLPVTGGEPRPATVTESLDRPHDLAVLHLQEPLDSPAIELALSDQVAEGATLAIQGYGVLEGTSGSFDWLPADGRVVGPGWQDGTRLLVVASQRVLLGMSGAPVLLANRDVLVGVVSGRYNSDNWYRDSVFVGRTEDLLVLLDQLRVNIGHSAPGPRGYRASYQSDTAYLLEDLTKSFVGRVSELDSLKDFVYAAEPGYGILGGPAGFGKSALLAHLITELNGARTPTPVDVIYMFVSETSGENTSEIFLMAVNSQLLDLIHERDEVGVAMDFAERRYQMDALWRSAIARASAAKPLVLVVDGLDEAAREGQTIASLLPRQFRPHCHVLVSVRSPEALRDGADPHHPLQAAQIWQLTVMGDAEIRDLLIQYGMNSRHASRLAPQVLHRTGGEPLFVRFVCEEVSNDESILQRLERAPPSGVKEYFGQQLDQLRNTPSELSGLCVDMLAVADEGLSVEELASLFQRRVSRIEQAIKTFARFTRGTGRLELMHALLKEAVVADLLPEGVDARRRDLADWCGRFADDDWPSRTPWYVAAHGVDHFLEVNDQDRLWTILGEQWVNLQLERSTPDRIMHNLRAAVAAAADDAQGVADAISALLILARVLSVAELVPDAVLRLLARDGQRERALAYARARESAKRFQAICYVAEGVALRGERSEAQSLLRGILPDASAVWPRDTAEAIVAVARAASRAGCAGMGAAIVDALAARLDESTDGLQELLAWNEAQSWIADLWLGRADVPALVADAAQMPAQIAVAIARALVLTGHEEDASRVARQAGPGTAAAIAAALHSMDQTAKAREKAQAAYRQLMRHPNSSAAIDVARALAELGGFDSELHELARLADSAAASRQARSGRGPARRALLRVAELYALAGESDRAWQCFNSLGDDLNHDDYHELFLDFVLAGRFDDAQRALFLPGTRIQADMVGEGAELLWRRGDRERARRWISLAIRLSKLRTWSGAEGWAIIRLADALLRNDSIDTVLGNVGSPGRLRDSLLIEIARWNATERRYGDVQRLMEMMDDKAERARGYATCAVTAAKNLSEEWLQRFAGQAKDILAALPESARQGARHGVALRLAVAGVDAETLERFTVGLVDWEIKGVWEKYVDDLVDQSLLVEARRIASARGIESRKLRQAKLCEDVRALGVTDISRLLRQMPHDENETVVASFLAYDDETVTDQAAVAESLIQVGRFDDARALAADIPKMDRDQVLTALVRAETTARHPTDVSQLIADIHEPRWQAVAEAAAFAGEEHTGREASHKLAEFLRQMERRFIDRDRMSALKELALSLKSQPELALPAARSALSASASQGDHEFFRTLGALVPVLEALPNSTALRLVFIRLLGITARLV